MEMATKGIDRKPFSKRTFLHALFSKTYSERPILDIEF
jgi:hypothetical protein